MARFAGTLLVLLLLVSPGRGEDEAPRLRILKAKVRFGRLDGGDSLALKGTFDPAALPPGGVTETSSVSVTIGPVAVISFPPLTERDRLRTRKAGKLLLARRKTPENRDSVRLLLDADRGRFSVIGRRLDLGALRSAGPEDVTITLSVEGVVFGETITLGERDGRWRYRYFAGNAGGGFSGWPGGGGGGGTSGGGPVSFRTLWQGSFPGLTTFKTTVIRTETEYSSEWMKRYPPPPPGVGAPVMGPPFVDFSREMVVVIDLGTRPTGGYSVEVVAATAAGTGLRIDWVEKRPGPNCVVTQALTQPFVMAAVTRREGPVSFSGSVRTIQCP